MDISESEPAAEATLEVEITSLDAPRQSGKAPGRWTPTTRIHVGLFLATIASLALLGIILLVNVVPLPKGAKVSASARISYPLSLAVVDGICYTIATNGVMTALRVSDGKLLWRNAGGDVGEHVLTVANGIIYLVPFFPLVSTVIPRDSIAMTLTLKAFRARNGTPLWSRTLPRDALTLFQITAANGVVYIRSVANAIEALRAEDGSVLWHYTSQSPFVSTVAGGIVYALRRDNQLLALGGHSGLPLWNASNHTPPAWPLPPVVANGMLFLNLQNGGIEAVRTDTGAFLWGYTPRHTDGALFSQPFIANGAVYGLTQNGSLVALNERAGSTLWHTPLQPTNPLLPPLFVVDGVIYVRAMDGGVEALRERTGSVLWHQRGRTRALESMMMTQSVIFLATSTTTVDTIESVTVLRASDGAMLWRNTPSTPARQFIPIPMGNLVLLTLQDGSIKAFDASNGSLRWQQMQNS